MAYKQILVSMGNPVGRNTARIAAQLAAAQGGRLRGRHFTFERPLPGPGATHVPVGHPAGGMLAQPAPARPEPEQTPSAGEARELFQQAATEARVEGDFESAAGGRRPPWECLVTPARCCDLTVVGKPRGAPEEKDLIKQLAAESGGPVLVVPDSATQTPGERHVLIAWNGSQEAARAVRDALPLIEAAGRATIFLAKPDDRHEGSAHRLQGYLEAHGARCEIKRGDGGRRPADALLGQAEGLNADTIVMGAYGRARLREWVTGGGTTGRTIENATIPLLLAH